MIVKPQDRKGMRPIPTRLFRRSEKKDKLIARIDEKTFQEAPSFQKSDRPELSRSKWENEVRGYYMEAEQKSE